MRINLQAIGFVQNTRKAIVDDNWGSVVSEIKFDVELFSNDALSGITEFSHVEVIFYMDQVNPEKIVTGSHHPRNDESLPKFGILAQRGKNRPNQIGVSFAEVVACDGLTLQVRGLDAIDGTPVLDIKPCLQEFLPRGEIKQAAWTHELMRDYYSD